MQPPVLSGAHSELESCALNVSFKQHVTEEVTLFPASCCHPLGLASTSTLPVGW
jgi:hypothetical protein